jgi:hypothetical protein
MAHMIGAMGMGLICLTASSLGRVGRGCEIIE